MGRRLFFWWYASIALAFVLLAVRSIVLGGKPLPIALRFVIAAGFGILAGLEFRGRLR